MLRYLQLDSSSDERCASVVSFMFQSFQFTSLSHALHAHEVCTHPAPTAGVTLA